MLLLSGPASKAYVINPHSRNSPVPVPYRVPLPQLHDAGGSTCSMVRNVFTRHPCAFPRFEGFVAVLICMTVVRLGLCDQLHILALSFLVNRHVFIDHITVFTSQWKLFLRRNQV